MKNNNTGAASWFGLAAIMVWCLLPVVWIISLSFKSLEETTAGSAQFLPKDATLQNYRDILANPDFIDALRNSFGVSLIATFLSVVFATFAAYAIARLEFRGKRVRSSCWRWRSPCSRSSLWWARCSTCGAPSACSTPGPA